MSVPNRISTKDVAREALRALVVRRLDPSPDNYRRLFNEIAGIADEPASAAAEEMLGQVASGFPRGSPDLLRLAKTMERAVAKRDWKLYAGALTEAAEALSCHQSSGESWRALLRQLLHNLDVGHRGLTRARKKERLERTLEMRVAGPEQLQQKLAALVKSWSELPNDNGTIELAEPDSAAGQAAQTAKVIALNPPGEPFIPNDFAVDPGVVCALLAEALDVGLAGVLAYDPELSSEARSLAAQARAARDEKEVASLRDATREFLLKVELNTSSTAELHQGLLRLLRLVINNVGELVGEDEWLQGQITALAEIMAKPLDLVMIEHAERSIMDAMVRQGTLRHSLTEAKSAFKSMVSGFIDRLGDFSASTGDYHEIIENLSQKISQTNDMTQLGQLLEDFAAATRTVQAATLRSRDQTLETQREVQAAEQKIRELQSELVRVSAKVREDQLTGVLNRRGLEEEFERARSASERRNEPVSLALLDIDNFKNLNDTHGHDAGDAALVHLATVIKGIVRPTDSVCRYGGEEFVILLPSTGLQDAAGVISRLQRELTKRYFLHENQRLLITFSAGVAERRPGEARADTISRADAAMYMAKRTGKNRVVTAD